MGFTPNPQLFGPSSLADDPHQTVTVSPPAGEVAELLALQASLHSLRPASVSGFHAALLANTQAEGNLSGLARMVEELSGGVLSAQRVNEQLRAELAALRELLGSANEQQLYSKNRVSALEHELSAAQLDAELAGDSLVEQHDIFLKALLEEHEEQLSATRARELSAELRAIEAEEELRERSAAFAVSASSPSELAELTLRFEAERELARGALKKLLGERDEAEERAQRFERKCAELEHRFFGTAAPALASSALPSELSAHATAALTLDARDLDSVLHGPRTPLPPAAAAKASSTPAAPSVRSTPAAPKGAAPPLQRAPSDPTPTSLPTGTSASPAASSGASSSHPPLRSKPDPSSRPLIGYTVGRDTVATETLEGARLSSKPPKSRG